MGFNLFGLKSRKKLSVGELKDLVAKVLLQMVWIDGSADEREVLVVARILEHVYRLPHAAVRQEIDTFDHKRQNIDALAKALRENLPLRDRVQLMRDLWSVAIATGEATPHEQAFFYRVATALGIKDNEFFERCIKVPRH